MDFSPVMGYVATQHLPDYLMADWPGVSWRDIGGFRNTLEDDDLNVIDAPTVRSLIVREKWRCDEINKMLRWLGEGALFIDQIGL